MRHRLALALLLRPRFGRQMLKEAHAVNGSSSVFIVLSLGTVLLTCMAVLTCLALPGRAGRTSKPASHRIAAEYLYVPCIQTPSSGYLAQTRRWVQEVPIVKKTAKWIYYTSETLDRRAAVVSPGCISREQFESDTRCHGYMHCLHGEGPCRHGYPSGVIPIPSERRSGPARQLFFASREAAEADLYRSEHNRSGQAVRGTPPINELRRAMADAHPDRGGTNEQFIQARHRYEAALQPARR